MHDDFNSADLPTLRDVDYEALAEAPTEKLFTREGFERLKDPSIVLTTVAGLRAAIHASGLTRIRYGVHDAGPEDSEEATSTSEADDKLLSARKPRSYAATK